MAGSIRKLNDRVARSAFGRYFLLEGSGHPKERKGARFTTEILGGLTNILINGPVFTRVAPINSDTVYRAVF